MKKKIIKKKVTLEDISLDLRSLHEKIDNKFRNVHERIDNLKDHMDQKFDEQTEEFIDKIRTVLDLVDKRFIPIGHSKNSRRAHSL